MKKLSVEETEQKLVDYHFAIDEAARELIDLIMPIDYRNSVSATDFAINTLDVVKRQQRDS